MARAKYVYFNGRIVLWEAAHIHVFSPVAKYGIGVFEGIRGYWNAEAQEIYLFRVKEHMQRLAYSQSVMRFEETIDGDGLIDPLIELVRVNGFRETIHARVQVYVDGDGDISAAARWALPSPRCRARCRSR
jgi:branched-chain amino acid aminotransferase